MPTINLTTIIKAPIERCFDLSLSIDLHKISTTRTNEEAIAGRTSGFIQLNETVTWRAKHLGIVQTLTTKITALTKPYHFRDEQIKGTFKKLEHDHYFEQKNNETIMRDVFYYESPGWFIGKAFNIYFLTKYLTAFLIERNNTIKEFAETERWKEIINCEL